MTSPYAFLETPACYEADTIALCLYEFFCG